MTSIARGQMTISEQYDGKDGIDGIDGTNGTDGLDGADAVIYQLEVSPDQINKSETGILSSSSITVRSYKRVGNSTRSAYSCRFKIYENNTLKYTSSANEISKVYTISSVAIKSVKVEMYVAGATTSMLETKTILIIQDGATGATGISGALLRPRGVWKSQTSYVKNTTYVDTVIYNSVNYMCVASHASGSTFDSSKWLEANELIFVATQALLAGKGTIDVLGAGELFVGNLAKTIGWSFTNGMIRHTGTGLTLGSDGKIYSPNGASIIVGEAPLDQYTNEKAQYAVDNIEIGTVNLIPNSGNFKNTNEWGVGGGVTISVDNTKLKAVYTNAQTSNQLKTPIFKLEKNKTYTIAFDYEADGDFWLEMVNPNWSIYPFYSILNNGSHRWVYTYTHLSDETDFFLYFMKRADFNPVLNNLILNSIMLVEGNKAPASWIIPTSDLVEKEKLKQTGIDIDQDTILLKANKIQFADAYGGNRDKISVNPETGGLKAVDGEFSGKITSTSGKIGCFEIAGDRLGIPISFNEGMTFSDSHLYMRNTFRSIYMSLNKMSMAGIEAVLLELKDISNYTPAGPICGLKINVSNPNSQYKVKAIDYVGDIVGDGNIKSIGDIALFEKGYIGQAHGYAITENLERTHTYIFNSTALANTTVFLPSANQVRTATLGHSSVSFQLKIIMANFSSRSNKVTIQGVSGGQLVDTNGNNSNGGYGSIDMYVGDTLTLQYVGDNYMVLSHQP